MEHQVTKIFGADNLARANRLGSTIRNEKGTQHMVFNGAGELIHTARTMKECKIYLQELEASSK